MKSKKQKPKDELIRSVLDDLNKIPDDSIQIGPNGIQTDDISLKDLVDGEEKNHADSVLKHDFSVPEDTALKGLLEDEISLKTPEADDRTLALDSEPPAGFISEEKKADSPRAVVNPPSPAPGLMINPVSASKTPPVPPLATPIAQPAQKISYEAQFTRADNYKAAQSRILELEKEIDRLRKENEVLSSANEIAREKMDQLVSQIHQLDKQRHDLKEVNESELRIFKEALIAKDSEILRLRNKVEDLESRLSNDLKKVRVRERELENRLELAKVEKTALLRAKDENILDLKRRTESLEGEIETYQNKIIELGQKLEFNQEQFARTVRALRLALTNLEVSDGTSPSITIAPLKKAE